MKKNLRTLLGLAGLLSGLAGGWGWLALPFPLEDLASPEPDARVHRPDDWLTFEEFSPWLVQATVAAEDQRFWDHDGVDIRAIDRALWQGASEGRWVSGASTITMQLVKLARPEAHRRTLLAKLRQARAATALERRASKVFIMEQYLNRAYYGAGAQGAGAASRVYFEKPALRLALAEAALLAGLPRAPSALNPLRNPAAARDRRRYVLGRMAALGLITAGEEDAAGRAPLRPLAR